MNGETIHNCITAIENKVTRDIAINFVDFLSDNKMTFEKVGGYWENQQYFYVKYKGEFVCCMGSIHTFLSDVFSNFAEV